MELVLPLTRVGSLAGVDRSAPERALDVDRGGRIWRGVTGDEGGIALKVHVEAVAIWGRVAVFLALDRVVGVQSIVSKVGRTLNGGLEVGEGKLVALSDRRSICGVLQKVSFVLIMIRQLDALTL